MISIQPFKALRPEAQYAKQVASLPYDVLNSKEAKTAVQGNPSSFLHITKSEIDLPETVDVHDQKVYDTAKKNLTAFISRNILFRENKDCYYIYQLVMNGRSQTGLVCGSSVDDYENGLIKKHEFTRPEKEQDRINHIKTTGAQTGNVFLAYNDVEEISTLINKWKKEKNPVYDMVAADGVQHTIWIVNDNATIDSITELFKTKVPCTYIADGHHRAASAAKVRQALGKKSAKGADIFLTTLFPASELIIMDYNRVVKDLNGWSEAEVLEKIADKFLFEKAAEAVAPAQLHQFGMYLNQQWYTLTAKEGTYTADPIGVLDVTILQDNLLSPLLGIADPRTDKRIDFVGGIRGLGELEKRVNSGEMQIAFSLYPVSIQQLIDIADSGNVMPPKSTWFEPKLRDGFLTHLIYD
ncbi:MAG TPA: DUF1015 family protein [Ferruginibacter sp.]|nr:DUF1015 family protein [Ferruginibacter sp.]HMP19682.1 DUF1015 family protein [Ferruginibacter sp.]